MASGLEDQASEAHRYTDQAIQFVEYERGKNGKPKKTGRTSPVLGGVWDRWMNCYAPERAPIRVVRYRVNAKQYKILGRAARGDVHHFLICGGRRSSKSETLALWTILRMIALPGKRVSLTFPKFGKAREWVMEKFLPRIQPLLMPGKAGWKKSLFEMCLTTENGASCIFITAETVNAPRGSGIASGGCDERQIVKREVMDNQFLSLSEGGARYQTFEDATALQGEFQDYFDEASQDSDYHVEVMSSFDNCFISTEFLEDARKHMDPRRYAQEVLAQFQPQTAVVYHQFSRDVHVQPVDAAKRIIASRYGLSADGGRDITAKVARQWFKHESDFFIGMDFNVSPMVAVVYRIFQAPAGIADIWWGVDELVIEDGADAIRMGHALKTAGYFPAIVIPDASGARSEGGKSSHRMLRDAGFAVYASGRNPAVPDRINSVNAKLFNARGHVTLFFDPKCRTTIKALQNHKNDAHGKPEKDSVHDHRSDALGYPIAYMCPVAIDWESKNRTARAVANG